MSNRTQPATSTYVDSQGRNIVSVSLARGNDHAELTLDDYERIVAAGFTGPWYWNSNGQRHAYVRIHHDGGWGLETASRMIACAGPGERVKYRDGNPRNLRPENLVLVEGRASRPCGEMLEWQLQFRASLPA